MQREQFHAVISRAAQICAPDQPIVFGSQCVHAITESPPAEVLISIECDIWMPADGTAAGRLTAELGKESAFAKETGVYADVLPPDLPTLPPKWQERLVSYTSASANAKCLEIHDLIVSKLAAGRLKDYEFIASVLLARLASMEEVRRRLQTIEDVHARTILFARLRIAAEASDLSF